MFQQFVLHILCTNFSQFEQLKKKTNFFLVQNMSYFESQMEIIKNPYFFKFIVWEWTMSDLVKYRTDLWSSLKLTVLVFYNA